MSTTEVFVVSALRTAIGGFGGSLKDVSPIELGTQVSRAAIAGSGLAAEHIGHVVMGHVIPTEVRDAYLSRVIALEAGLTKETPAMNVNRLCGSGLQAIVSAAQSVMFGDAKAVLAGGAESMSRGAYIMPQARWGARMGNVQAYDYMLGALHDPFANIHMGITAENIAENYGITRADQDALALTSQQRAARAIAEGGKPPSQPLAHYGMHELAELGQSMQSMAGTLHSRSREIATYTDHVTHELKSPVTSITGAAELLEEPALSPEDRRRLLDNIRTEAARMNTLLTRLREMTQLRQAVKSGPGRLLDMLPEIDGLAIRVDDPGNALLPLSQEHGQVILAHMAQNARAHGANVLTLAYADGLLRVSDDGTGLSESDIPRLADPFFTTRREEGGTGMGLAIVTAVLDGYGAALTAAASPHGAVFEIRFP